MSKPSLKTIIQTIAIHPKFLDENIEKAIKDKIYSIYLHKCEETIGYVNEIIDDSILILNNYISSAGTGIFFKVKFNVNSIKPKEGKEYEGKVCLIFDRGLLLEVFGSIKVFVPIDKTNGYKFVNNFLVKDKKIIKKDDIIQVKILTIKFEKKSYRCIGNLKEN